MVMMIQLEQVDSLHYKLYAPTCIFVVFSKLERWISLFRVLFLLFVFLHVVVIGLTNTNEISIKCTDYDGLSKNSPNINLLRDLFVSLVPFWASGTRINGVFLVQKKEVADGPDTSESN